MTTAEQILMVMLVISNVYLWMNQVKTTKRLLELVELLAKEREDKE